MPLSAWPDPDAQYRMSYQIAVGALTPEHADRVTQYLADQTRRERIRQAVQNRISHPSLSTYFGDASLPVRSAADPGSPIVGTLQPGGLVKLGEVFGGAGEGPVPTPVTYPVGIILPAGEGPRGFVSVERQGRSRGRDFVPGRDLRADTDVKDLSASINAPAQSSYPCDGWSAWYTKGQTDLRAVNAFVMARNSSTSAVAERVLAQAGLDAYHDRVVRAVADRVANRPWDTYLDDTPLTVRGTPADDSPAIATIMPGDRIELLGSVPTLAPSGAVREVARVRVPALDASRTVEGYFIGPAVEGSLWPGQSSLLTVGRSQQTVGVTLADLPAVTDRSIRTFLEVAGSDRARVDGVLESPELPGPVVVISSIGKFSLGAANNNHAGRVIDVFDTRTGAHIQTVKDRSGSSSAIPHFDGAGFDIVANGHGKQDASCCPTALAVTRYRWDGDSFADVSTVTMQIPRK